MVKALVIDRDDNGTFTEFRDIAESDLPSGQAAGGDVLVDIAYSTINYKDGLALTGKSPVVRSFPMVGGIDFAGTVAESDHPDIAVGTQVVCNGWGMSERVWGGYATRMRVPGAWLVPLPKKIAPRQAMAIGTAGYTAMLCVMALQDDDVMPEDGDILVTGAAGGVGSVAIALLAELGYRVIASTGRMTEAPYLNSLGAAEILDRATLSEPGKPLGKERWAGAVDSVGSTTLANVLAQTTYGGTVAACGLAQGMDLPSTVMPFILRGVTLRGIDSVMAPLEKRLRAWDDLAAHLDLDRLETMTQEIAFEDVPHVAPDILSGGLRGRTVVKIGA